MELPWEFMRRNCRGCLSNNISSSSGRSDRPLLGQVGAGSSSAPDDTSQESTIASLMRLLASTGARRHSGAGLSSRVRSMFNRRTALVSGHTFDVRRVLLLDREVLRRRAHSPLPGGRTVLIARSSGNAGSGILGTWGCGGTAGVSGAIWVAWEMRGRAGSLLLSDIARRPRILGLDALVSLRLRVCRSRVLGHHGQSRARDGGKQHQCCIAHGGFLHTLLPLNQPARRGTFPFRTRFQVEIGFSRP